MCIKFSNLTPNINAIMKDIIKFCFEPKYVSTIEDKDLKDYEEIYHYEPNMVFFTGSTRVGKINEQECALYEE